MSSKATFLQDSFTHVLRNQNAKPTPAIAAKKMSRKKQTLVFFTSIL